jgi:Ca-activated chloride channel family protein
MIDSLGDADRVAVIAFDDRMEHLGDSAELVPANDLNRWKLVEWLAAIDARGGTELVPAVAAGLKLCGAARKAAAARRRVVVLVTDAQVGDEDRVLRTLAASLGDTRLFVVGIDTAVNEGLLSRLADASGGLTELVESEERLDEVMDRIHARIQTPLVSELRIEGDGVELIAESIVPARMPDLVAGLPLVVRGRCRWAGAGARVHVEGRAHGGGIWRATAVVPKQATPGLACLWARGMLRRLEDERITSESATVDDDAIEQPEEEQTAEAIESRIVALSTSFGVLCRFTALVAIDARRPDERVRRLTPRRIVQPIDAASGMARWAMCVNYSSASFPGSFDDALYCCDFGEGGGGSWNQPAADPLAAERTEAARLVARVKPRRGSLDDVKPSRVSGLLRGVLRLLRRLGKHHAAPELIETLAAAYARLFAVPTDRAALVALLDGLAVFGAEKGARVDRWWEAARGGAIP